MGVRIVADSVSYLAPSMVEGLPVEVVSLYVVDGDVSVRETEIGDREFYDRLAASPTLPTSSQPSVVELAAAFRAGAEAGDDVVGVFISSDMSGTVQAAGLARDLVLEQWPETRIEIVDSRSNCMEEGFAVLAAARTAAAGGTVEEAAQAARDMTRHTRFVFVPKDLENLRKGGRIGRASALVGSILQIVPILTVADGVTSTLGKTRTRSKAMAEVISRLAEDAAAKGLVEVVVHHIDDPDAGARLAGMAAEVAGHPVPVVPIGPVIGIHVGRGAVGVVYVTREPMDK
jgi:DegV family protein with EDD domain